VQQNEVAPQPWTIEKAPVRIIAKAKKIPAWQKYGGITGPIPWSPITSIEPTEEVTLVPYGCTKLRISEFPVIDQP
jgi:hypothetical protein